MNRGELRAHFIAVLNRSDCPAALADTFIDQAQSRITRLLRIPPMEKTHTYNVATDVSNNDFGVASVVIPSDLIEAIDIYSGKYALTRLPLHEMIGAQDSGQVGTPKHFTRVQGTFLLHPSPSTGTVVLNYYGSFGALTADASTNTLTTLGPDLLIYTALSYAADYFLDERSQTFEAKASQFLAEIQEQANSSEQSGGTQVIRPSTTYED